MEEVINKYIRRHIKIKGNKVHFQSLFPPEFESNIIDIFSLESFSIWKWINFNVNHIYVIYWGDDDDVEPVMTWYNGILEHRRDGPSSIYKDGREEYYLNGEKFTKEEWTNLLTNI